MKKIDIACIIDDDQIYVFGLKKLLQVSGYSKNLLVFHNGEEALKYLTPIISSDQMPDVILLDINMPVMDGWDFLDEFLKVKHQLSKKVTIYIVSSSIHDEDINRVKQYEDVADYIIKPISYEDLKKIME